MGKTFGLFACATMVAASVWWASSQQTSQAIMAGIGLESSPGGPPGFGGSPSTGDQRQLAAMQARINDLMRRAVQMEARGNKNAAIRFASSANALVRSARIELNPGVESPAEMVARLQGRPVPRTRTTPPAVETGNPFAVQPQVQQVAGSRPAPNLPGADTPAKKRAQELLRQARRAFDGGDYDSARSLALEAKKHQAVWGLFEENPDQLITDIERKSGMTKFAPETIAENKPVDVLVPEAAPGNPFAPVKPAPTEPKVAGNPFATTSPESKAVPEAKPSLNEANRKKANALMAEARQLADAGKFGAAREKIQQAEQLDVVYAVFDKRPDLVLRDINRQEAESRLLVAQPQITPQPKPQANPAEIAKKKQAQSLLAGARDDIRAGQYAAAEAKVQQAKQLNVKYDNQFDDTPELVAELLKQYKQPKPMAPPEFPAFPEPVKPVATQEPPAFPEPMKTASKEEAGPDFGTPNGGNPFATVPPVKEPKVEQAGSFSIAKEAPAPPATKPAGVHPSGVVAAELFDRGLKHFNDGRYEEAYDAFLNCYRTGQKMDPYRTQSLQDMLQTLRPMIAKRNNSGIRQVKNEVVNNRRVGPGSDNDFQPGSIDLAQKAQAVKYEKMRSETLNAIFQADRLREKRPTEALELIDRTITSVTDADLSEREMAPLLRQLNNARGDIEAYQKQKAPILALEEQNRATLEQIKKERETEVRIEQELADMVEEYNTFFKQRRYAEAEVIAKKARELDRENPVTETMFWKARFARRDARNEELRDLKEDGFIQALDSVEWSAIPVDDRDPISFPKNWDELSKRRQGRYGTDNRIKTEKEKQIERSLKRPISLQFSAAPLNEVVKHIATSAGIDVVVDNLGLSEEGILPDQPVSIDVNGIKLESALNLILKPLNLAYITQDEVLKITSRIREQGKLEVVTYPVADLIVPIPNFTPSGGTGLQSSGPANNSWNGPANFSVPAGGGSLQPVGGAQFQVGDNNFGGADSPWAAPGLDSSLSGGGSAVDFDTLSELIVHTIEPDTWAEAGGSGSVRSYETTLSLVIRQTQKVHEEIRDLLEQLRRLQDLQVTIEVRFITVADRFFERIGIDFDFNVQDNVEGDDLNLTPPAFGSPGQINPNNQNQQGNQGNQGQVGAGGIGGGPGAMNALIMGVPNQIQGQGQVGGQVGQGGQLGQGGQNVTGVNFLQPPVGLNTPALDDFPKNGTIVGLGAPGQFTPDLDVAFQQGSFDLGVPDFGNFNPDAGIQVGMAILTDIEAFFFIQAAQADERTNIMFAPKVTLFNGQQATVQSTTQRPFVTSLIPTVGFFSVGFTPQITVLSEGVTLQVQAVISADRRFVRLTVVPNFTNITDVFTFSFQGGGGGQGGANGAANNGVAGGGGFNPVGGQGAGGLAGIQGQGIQGGQVGGGQFGFGGIGGGPSPMTALALGLPNQIQGQIGGVGGVGGQVGGQLGQGAQVGGQVGGQGGQGVGGAVGNTTIQQPVFEVVNVTTTVSVPDGGTVLLGGIKRLREGRNMAGVPILNKIPYISRLFKNTGVGRETESLMLMVTPRIIIQEEEEELLGIPL